MKVLPLDDTQSRRGKWIFAIAVTTREVVQLFSAADTRAEKMNSKAEQTLVRRARLK